MGNEMGRGLIPGYEDALSPANRASFLLAVAVYLPPGLSVSIHAAISKSTLPHKH